MAKSKLKLKAIELRSKGISVKNIAEQIHVSKSTASLWVRDVILSVDQLEKLRQSEIKGAELGRMRSALLQKARRKEKIYKARQEGLDIVGSLTKRDLLLAGLALYWGEGSKKNKRIELCNSDPKMIKFFLYWLRECFGIPISDVKGYVGINEIHQAREKEVKRYWSHITGIPLSQFTKTSFKKAQSKKVYSNFNEHYGTFVVKPEKSGELYYKVIGLIEALAESLST